MKEEKNPIVIPSNGYRPILEEAVIRYQETEADMPKVSAPQESESNQS